MDAPCWIRYLLIAWNSTALEGDDVGEFPAGYRRLFETAGAVDDQSLLFEAFDQSSQRGKHLCFGQTVYFVCNLLERIERS